MFNNYYWRAVRRIAKRKGITIAKARRLDWRKEANAERKRRSKSHRKVHRPKPKRTRTTKPEIRHPVSRISSRGKSKIPRRVPKTDTGPVVPSRRPASKLKLKPYEEIRPRGEDIETEDDDIESETEWETDWESDYPDLDYFDELMDFLDDAEYADEDTYKEPA